MGTSEIYASDIRSGPAFRAERLSRALGGILQAERVGLSVLLFTAIHHGTLQRAGKIHARRYRKKTSGNQKKAPKATAIFVVTPAKHRRFGIEHTGLKSIAIEARVSRQTIYRYFNGRHEILTAVIQHDFDFLWQLITGQIQNIEKFEDYLIEALLLTLDYAKENPNHLTIFREDALEVLEDFLISNQEHARQLAWLLRPQYESRIGPGSPLLDAQLFILCEWFDRTLASYLCRPSRIFKSQEDLRWMLSLLVPSFEKKKGHLR